MFEREQGSRNHRMRDESSGDALFFILECERIHTPYSELM
jgi:hypothetical protein